MSTKYQNRLNDVAADLRALAWSSLDDNEGTTISEKEILDILKEYNVLALPINTLDDVIKLELIAELWDKLTIENLETLKNK